MHSAELFCRTYNIALVPEVWIRMAEQIPLTSKMLETYATAIFDSKNNAINPTTNNYADKTDLSFEKLNSL